MRCKKCRAGIAHEYRHGITGYNSHGCRCDVCVRVYNGYARAWKAKHRDKINRRNRAHAAAHREENRQKSRAYYAEHRDEITQRRRAYEAEHRDERNRTAGKWRQANRDKINRQQRDRRNANLAEARRKGREYDRAHRGERNRKGRERARANNAAGKPQQRQYPMTPEAAARKRFTNKERYRRNREYIRQRAKKAREQLKQIPDTHPNTWWTPEEDAILLRDDLSLLEMCYLTGRSYGGVGSRRNRLLAGKATTRATEKVKCSVGGCGRDMIARGWCSTHWSRWRHTGDVRADVPIRKGRGK